VDADAGEDRPDLGHDSVEEHLEAPRAGGDDRLHLAAVDLLE
jgi:hypothetical protein